MKRCTLHRTKLEEFKTWCAANGYEMREGKNANKGGYEVLQVFYYDRWYRIWDRNTGDHYTIEFALIPLVRKYINTRSTAKGKSIKKKLADNL